MKLFLGLSTVLSLALLGLAGDHKAHLNRNHDALAKRVPGTVTLHKRFSDSKWSWYDAQTGNAGACGDFIQNGDWAVALNTPQYGNSYPSQHCGKTITMRFNGKTAQAVVKDQCPGCPYGGLDLTPALFSYFADQGAGIIYGEWEFGSGAAPVVTTPAPKPTTTTTPVWKPVTTTTPVWKPATTTTPVWTPATTTWRAATTSRAPTTTWTPPTTSSTHESSSIAHSSSAAASISNARAASHAASSSSAAAASRSASAAGASASGSVEGLTGNSSVAATGNLASLSKVLLSYGNLAIDGAAVAA